MQMRVEREIHNSEKSRKLLSFCGLPGRGDIPYGFAYPIVYEEYSEVRIEFIKETPTNPFRWLVGFYITEEEFKKVLNAIHDFISRFEKSREAWTGTETYVIGQEVA